MPSKPTTIVKSPSKLSALRAKPLSTQTKGAQPTSTATSAAPVRWNPHQYQRKALRFLLDHNAAALLLDPGLGKTSITLAALKMLFKERVSRGALVVAPLRPASMTWPAEVTKWADFKDIDMVLLHGTKFSRLCAEKHDVYVINYEGLSKLFTRRKVGKVWKYELTADGKELMKNVDSLVWDELSKMKNSSSLRFTLIKPHIRKFARRWGLTGSPASNGLMDLFGQCYVLDEGNALGQFITHYRAEYFLPIDQYTWVLQHGAEERIYKKLRPLALRMDADDYLKDKMPQQMEITLKFELPAKGRAHYEEMEKELLTLIDQNLVTAANQASVSSKTRQICSGALYLPEFDPITGLPLQKQSTKRPWAPVHDEKLQVLADLVDELQGKQLMVAYDFKSDLERLLARWPNTPWIGGGVSIKKAKDIEDGWNRGDFPLMFVHPAAVAYGLNFQGSNAHDIAHFTLIWDFELYDQLNRRLRRQGNTADFVRVYQIVAKDSVEESVAVALRRKFKTQKALLDALKKRERLT